MNTSLQNERDAFNAFIDRRMTKVRSSLSLEDALTEFRAYQQELAQAQANVQEAKASSERGESEVLDIEQLIAEIAF
jgi:hypothetical protein